MLLLLISQVVFWAFEIIKIQGLLQQMKNFYDFYTLKNKIKMVIKCSERSFNF